MAERAIFEQAIEQLGACGSKRRRAAHAAEDEAAALVQDWLHADAAWFSALPSTPPLVVARLCARLCRLEVCAGKGWALMLVGTIGS